MCVPEVSEPSVCSRECAHVSCVGERVLLRVRCVYLCVTDFASRRYLWVSVCVRVCLSVLCDQLRARPQPPEQRGPQVGQRVPGAPYLRSRCMEWTPTFQTHPSGRPADACAADSGRRRVSGRPVRSAVSSGVLWTVGSGTTPGTGKRAMSLVGGILSLPGPPPLGPSASSLQGCPEADRLERRGGEGPQRTSQG